MEFKLLKFKDRDNFFAHIARVFRNLQLFTDVRVYCSDGTLQAHRLVLSTASPFLKRLLLDSEDQECSILIMKDFSCKVMEALFSFLYTGYCVLPSMYAGELHALTTNIGMNVHNIDLDLGSNINLNTKHKTLQRKELELHSAKPYNYEKQSKRFRSSNCSPSLGQSPTFHPTPPRQISLKGSPFPESNHSSINSQYPAHHSSSGPRRSSISMLSPKSQSKSPSIKNSPGPNHLSGNRHSPGLGHSSVHASSSFLKLSSQLSKTMEKAVKKRARKRKSDASVSISPSDTPRESPDRLSYVEASGPMGSNRGRPRGKGRPRIETTHDESQICGLCACVDPPTATASQTKWVGCNCDRWFHLRCLGLDEAPKSIKCSQFNKKCLPKVKALKVRQYRKRDDDEEEDDYQEGDWD